MPCRIGSSAAVLGAVVLLVATMLHPVGADPNNPAAAFSEYAADRNWVASHLGQFVGALLIFVGLHALARSLENDRVGPLADLALLVAVAALASAAVLQAVDGVALKVMVDRWAAAPAVQKPAAFEAALAVRHIEIGVAAFSAFLFGTAGILFGIALAAGARYPAWLGWLAIIGGAGTMVGGVLTAFTSFSAVEMSVAMPSNLVMLIWIAASGIVMWCRA